MKKLNLIGLIFFMCSLGVINASNNSADVPEKDIKWTTIEKSIAENKAANKNFIIVDLYTEWCGWCKKMDENTFTDQSIVSLMNENFTAVKFDAESKASVSFNGKSFGFVAKGNRGANQLAMDLGTVSGRLGYPTLVVLDASGNKLQSFPGYKDVETMQAILKYFKSGSYKTMDFQQFQSGQ